MNQGIIENLTILAKYYKKTGDGWRNQSYQRAIISIKGYPYEITDIKQITDKNKLPGIGKTMESKIKEYLDTGQIRKVEEVKTLISKKTHKNTEINTIDVFDRIWGVGSVKAAELWAAGFRSIDDVREDPSLLTSQQKIGLKYYDDLLQSLPRKYIDIFQVAIRLILNREFGVGSYELIIAGSYRRQESTSGDVDVLITSTHFTLPEMVSVLQRDGIITDILSMREEKFMGVVHCPSGQWYHFRMDIEFLPVEEFSSGLLYFTGSKGFNVAMRGDARKMGLKLTQHGLFRLNTGERLPVYTEKAIFKALGKEYVEPSCR